MQLNQGIAKHQDSFGKVRQLPRDDLRFVDSGPGSVVAPKAVDHAAPRRPEVIIDQRQAFIESFVPLHALAPGEAVSAEKVELAPEVESSNQIVRGLVRQTKKRFE